MIIDNSIAIEKNTQSALSPDDALELLKAGNDRFVQQRSLQRDLLSQVAQTGGGQFPFAAVLGCIDSRVPAELVFDQGIGDLFNVRIAGNFVNSDILGSLEFACKVAGAKVIVVLGHTSCGAIKGACDDVVLGNLTSMLANLTPAVKMVENDGEERSSKNGAFVHKVAEANITRTLSQIKAQSPVLNVMIESKEVLLVGAMYDVQTGIVKFRNYSA